MRRGAFCLRMETSLISLVGLVLTGTLLTLFTACGGSSSKPANVAITASATTVDSTDTVTLTATVTNDKNSLGVTWSVSGGGTLSGTTTSLATYTAPSSSISALTVTVTATSVADTTKNSTVTLKVPAAPTITTASSALTGAVGTAYSVQLAGSGGIAPYTWSLASGTLPACLTFNSAGAISGTPTAYCAGTTSLTFKLTDSGTPKALTATTQALNLTINAAPAIAFTTTSLTTGTYKSPYTATVTASGGAGALTYTLASGSLPTGLSLSAAGAISGTPTAAGTFPITIKAADAFGDSATQSYSIKVSYPALTVTPATLPVGYAGSNYTQTTLAATGGSGTGYTWALASGSTLPAGLNLSTAGVLSGKPTTAGTTSFTVTVTDSASNTANGTFSITIDAGVRITTATTLPTGYVGSNYTQTLAATGGSGTGYTWTITSGSTLPAGLSLTPAGALSGKPSAAGTPSFSITVTDSASNTATATFSMTVATGVSITTGTTLPAGYQGTAYPGATLTATGGTGTGYTWAWTAASGSPLPAGLSLSTGGAISGIPTAAGTFSIVITVSDSAQNTASATFTLAVQAALAITTTSPMKSGTINVAYSQQLTATGGGGADSWTTTGANNLASLNLSLSASGVLSGTPTTTGTSTFTAQVSDSATPAHTATATLSVTVYASLTVTTTTLPAAYTGTAYAQTLTAGGGSGTGYTWTATSSNLATYGLSLSAAGVISGTPAQAGTASFTAHVTDSSNNTATQPFTISVYGALTLPTPNPSSLGAATTSQSYNGTINASGGSGNYAWTVTGLPSDSLSSSSSGNTLSISGTPTTATTVTFGVSVKDTATGVSVGPYTYSIVVSNPPPLTLQVAGALPSATVNQSYSGGISASGGNTQSTYTFTVNGAAVPTSGTTVGLGTSGLTVSSFGNNILSIGGTPTTTGTVSFTVSVTNGSTTVGPYTYTIAVNSAGSQVSGQIQINNNCTGVSTLPTFTVSINTSPVQTTTTDSNGNYSFASVPNGTYMITPSINGPSSVFHPATLTNVVVNNNALSGENFSVELGYTVSGAASYSGADSGQVYLVLNNSNCGGNEEGTSITHATLSSGGAFTIRGVPPGSYTLQSTMDNLGQGEPNVSNPTGSASVSVSTANVTGVSVTLANPSLSAPTAAPKLNNITPANLGVVISYGAITNSNGAETVSSYTVQWSTTSDFASTASYSFPAIGKSANVWILNNSLSGMTGSFSSGTAYYFRARGVNSVGHSPSWAVWGGSTPVAVTIGTVTAGYNTVTGTVTIPSTITPTGPLYVGFYNQSNGSVYATQIASPASSNAFTVYVPSGSGYFFFEILDQNNDGLIDAGDVTNTNSNNSNTVTISGNLTGQNLTLPTANSAATVTTQYYQQTNPSGTATGYNLSFNVRVGNKLPVSATLTSGPNVINPVDISACNSCGHPQFQYNFAIDSDVPVVGQAYTFLMTYSDGSSETVTGMVTGVLTSSQFATNLEPSGNNSGSTTPTFTWTYPANAGSYIYQFDISSNNENIWQIPSNNSNTNGFPSTVTQIVWGTDPTGDSSNTPSLNSLTTGTQYNWQLETQDSNGNQAQTQVYFTVP